MHAHAKEFLTFLVSLLHVCVRLHSPRTAGTSVARAGGIFSRNSYPQYNANARTRGMKEKVVTRVGWWIWFPLLVRYC